MDLLKRTCEGRGLGEDKGDGEEEIADGAFGADKLAPQLLSMKLGADGGGRPLRLHSPSSSHLSDMHAGWLMVFVGEI